MRRNKHNNTKIIWKGKIDVEVARGVREELKTGRGSARGHTTINGGGVLFNIYYIR